MEHLNYCRQMVKQFLGPIGAHGFPEEYLRVLSHAVDLAHVSQKFLLPYGGRIYDDKEYRALDDNELLSLPYPCIALEYARPSGDATELECKSSKAIIFARQQDEEIVFLPVIWVDKHRMWAPMPEAAIPRIGYLDRTKTTNGYVAVKISRANLQIPVSDYCDEAGALLCFLNIIQCKNVHVERSAPKKAGKKTKSALSFDSYHVLTIDAPGRACDGDRTTGPHRAPREHLRRGHIRRLADGRRIWVNATVVAAGRGSGVVTKDYALRDFSGTKGGAE